MGNSAPAAPVVQNPPPQVQPGGCPVKHTSSSATNSNSATSECPVKYKNPNVYNVYSQKIDPKNQMPLAANQQPAADQQTNLCKDRVSSSIPKGGTDADTWLYPSPQMFWNALVRKNKTEGASETDIDAVIAVHNNMNETTWKQVLSWEDIHPTRTAGGEPKLLRFMGRPDELSPKARIKMLFGHPAPFDRHDWIVDRGGQEVRYVIDYYHDESGVGLDVRPSLHDTKSIRSIHVDVRPALDSVEALVDRVLKMPALQLRGLTTFSPPSFLPPKAMVAAESTKASFLTQQWRDIQLTCAGHKDKLRNCKTDEECGAATVGLQQCTAGIVCPDVARTFEQCVAAKPPASEASLGAAYGGVVKCLELFEIESRNELRK